MQVHQAVTNLDSWECQQLCQQLRYPAEFCLIDLNPPTIC